MRDILYLKTFKKYVDISPHVLTGIGSSYLKSRCIPDAQFGQINTLRIVLFVFRLS